MERLYKKLEFATKTNIASGQLVDESFVAQTTMENIIDFNNSANDIESLVGKVDELYNLIDNENSSYKFSSEQDEYTIVIELTQNTEYPDLVKIWIEVYNNNSVNDYPAILQNIIAVGTGE